MAVMYVAYCRCIRDDCMLLILQVVMFVYDITNYSSFENLDDWLAIVQQECFKGDTKPPHLALVANKSEPYIAIDSLVFISP